MKNILYHSVKDAIAALKRTSEETDAKTPQKEKEEEKEKEKEKEKEEKEAS